MDPIDQGGITSLRGFVFQKYIFLLLTLNNISPQQNIGYELDDDVSLPSSLSRSEIEPHFMDVLFLNTMGETLIQCKTGGMTNEVFKKVVMNWMRKEAKGERYVLYCEDAYEKPDLDKLNKAIAKAIASFDPEKDNQSSTLGNLYRKYIKCGIFTRDEFDSDLEELYLKIEIEVVTVRDLDEKMLSVYEKWSSRQELADSAFRAQLDELRRLVFEKIDDNALRLKRNFLLDHVEFQNIITDVKSRINDERFDVLYVQFRKETEQRVEELILNGGRLPNFLKKISKNDKFICQHLLYELYYERYRKYKLDLNKNTDVDSVENQAFENYVECLAYYGDDVRVLFQKTLDKSISFPQSNIDQKERSKGCYLFLSSDNSLGSTYFIDWNGENAYGES